MIITAKQSMQHNPLSFCPDLHNAVLLRRWPDHSSLRRRSSLRSSQYSITRFLFVPILTTLFFLVVGLIIFLFIDDHHGKAVNTA